MKNKCEEILEDVGKMEEAKVVEQKVNDQVIMKDKQHDGMTGVIVSINPDKTFQIKVGQKNLQSVKASDFEVRQEGTGN